MKSLTLNEASFSATPIKESEGQAKGIWLIRLIEADVQGSSGFYPSETLRRDGPTVFPKGTHVFFDHPAMDEDWNRPERSVRDLAGEFVEDAYFVEGGTNGSGLFARVQLFPDVHQWMESRYNSVGMSIRAEGLAADGDYGPTIVELSRGLSVDIVTRAGAGGKVLSFMESGKKSGPQGGNTSGADTSALENKLDSLLEGQNKTSEALTNLAQVLKESLAKPGVENKDQEKEEGLSVADLVEKLDESTLPAVSRKRVASAYKAGDDLDSLIKDESELVRQIAESAVAQKTTDSKGTAGNSVNSGVVEESAKSGDSKKTMDDVFDFLGIGD